jgi:hypothetical protein
MRGGVEATRTRRPGLTQRSLDECHGNNRDREQDRDERFGVAGNI